MMKCVPEAMGPEFKLCTVHTASGDVIYYAVETPSGVKLTRTVQVPNPDYKPNAIQDSDGRFKRPANMPDLWATAPDPASLPSLLWLDAQQRIADRQADGK